MIIMLSILLGFASSAFWSLIISLAQEAVDPVATVSVTGLIQSIGLIAGIVSPIVSARLINAAGFQAALTTCVCIPYLIHGALILMARTN
jgi:cyanate permease